MAIITDLLNNITGLSFRQTINNNFDNLNNDKAEVSVVSSISNRVTIEEAHSLLVDASLLQLQDDVTTVTDAVTYIQDINNFNYTYVSNHTVTNDVYEDVINTTYTGLTDGVYQLQLSMLHNIDSVNNSAYFRFSINGGLNWVEVRKESKDVSDILNDVYIKILSISTPTFNLIVQSRKENASDILNIIELTATLERKQ